MLIYIQFSNFQFYYNDEDIINIMTHLQKDSNIYRYENRPHFIFLIIAWIEFLLVFNNLFFLLFYFISRMIYRKIIDSSFFR